MVTMAKQKKDQLGAFYAGKPVIGLGLTPEVEESHARGQQTHTRENDAEADNSTKVLSNVHGKGEIHRHTVHGRTSVRLRGRTDATYDGGSFRTENVRLRAGRECANCSGRDCIHVTGTLVATYSVTTQVTLPSVSDFPDLTPCQRQRVQDAISNVLAPHEQEHVRAFQQYNGTTRQRFDLTLCRSEFDSTIQSLFEAEERTRRGTAQSASDALDPFHFDVDLNCEEDSATGASPEEVIAQEQETNGE
jgi:hypothetical protein